MTEAYIFENESDEVYVAKMKHRQTVAGARNLLHEKADTEENLTYKGSIGIIEVENYIKISPDND